ncbi:nucleotidyltransferase domain-containing protein [Marinoscillum sp.]|uniref:nucleotidyltransferase domain-containing protein n=1 Tax=Marinoscillum sp. TaxID=2024838 RepID=UPI003BA8B496
MRLSAKEIEHIKKVTEITFGKDAEVYLFGSRVSETANGGDIDLLIRTSHHQNKLKLKIQFLARLKATLGDQKIDVIIRSEEQPAQNDLIYLNALSGEKL